MLTWVDAGTNLQQLQAAAAASTGTPGWLTALIAGLAAILAATATALSSAYAAKRKVAEIELANAFQLASKYLESARQYTQTVYLPLAVEVHNLHAAFLDFNAVTRKTKVPAAKKQFSYDIGTFVTFANGQFKAGASAVFTFKLEDTLTGFISFLDKSRSADSPVIINEVEMTYSFGYFGSRVENRLVRRVPSKQSSFDPSVVEIGLRIVGMGVRVKRTPMLAAAPLSSDDFAERFTVDVSRIKAAIKEVTLGAYNAPSG